MGKCTFIKIICKIMLLKIACKSSSNLSNYKDIISACCHNRKHYQKCFDGTGAAISRGGLNFAWVACVPYQPGCTPGWQQAMQTKESLCHPHRRPAPSSYRLLPAQPKSLYCNHLWSIPADGRTPSPYKSAFPIKVSKSLYKKKKTMKELTL